MNARTIIAAALTATALATTGCGASADNDRGGAGKPSAPKPAGDSYGNTIVLGSGGNPNPGGISAKDIATACPLRDKEFADVAIAAQKQGGMSVAVVTCKPKARVAR